MPTGDSLGSPARTIRLFPILALLLASFGASAAPDSSDRDELFPNGRLFPCAAYSIGGTDGKIGADAFGPFGRAGELKRAKAMGLNLLGPQYELNPQVLADAATVGMKAIFTVGADIDGATWVSTPTAVEEVRNTVVRQVSEVAADRRIAWWYLRQEELRHWRPNEMRYLETVASALRAADPHQRGLLMYEPGHRNTSDLVTTGRHLGAITMGVYLNYMKLEDRRAWVGVAMQRQVAAARETGGKPVFFIPEMFANVSNPAMIPTWTAHDVFRALAEGAQGLILFSMRRRANFTDFEKYISGYAAVMPLVCGNAELGQAMLFGESRPDVTIRQVSGSTTIPLKTQGIDAVGQAIGFAVRSYRKSLYALVVNSSAVPFTGYLEGLRLSEAGTERLWGPPSTFDPHTGKIELSRWEALVLKISD